MKKIFLLFVILLSSLLLLSCTKKDPDFGDYDTPLSVAGFIVKLNGRVGGENEGVYVEIVNPSEEVRACELQAGKIAERDATYENYHLRCPYEETFVLEGHSSKTFILYNCYNAWLHNSKIEIFINGISCQFYV